MMVSSALAEDTRKIGTKPPVTVVAMIAEILLKVALNTINHKPAV
jgi:hypothetical protein